MSRDQAERWAKEYNARVPSGKDLVYEVVEGRRGFKVVARHPEREARPSLRERYGETLATRLVQIAFWGVLLGGGYLLLGGADSAEVASGSCHPDYSECLDPEAYDYDCEGGTGDGPEYTGFVEVRGADPFDLDRDGDGTGCE